MNGYLIPAKSKKGTLIFNLFRTVDLIILCIGVGVTLLLLGFIPNTSIVLTIMALVPGCVCALLVMPVPNYHNVLCAIGSMYNFYTKRRKYIWKGWCFNEQFSEKSRK